MKTEVAAALKGTENPEIGKFIRKFSRSFSRLQIAIQTSRYRAIIPYISAAVVDLLVSSAYLVVLLAQLIRGEQTDPVSL